ncbi:hypothetical protein BHE74_00038018 [Ensete ventricosum]|nr:hypothetical protein BHE74_00038018 [Ensete ventricosum]
MMRAPKRTKKKKKKKPSRLISEKGRLRLAFLVLFLKPSVLMRSLSVGQLAWVRAGGRGFMVVSTTPGYDPMTRRYVAFQVAQPVQAWPPGRRSGTRGGAHIMSVQSRDGWEGGFVVNEVHVFLVDLDYGFGCLDRNFLGCG